MKLAGLLVGILLLGGCVSAPPVRHEAVRIADQYQQQGLILFQRGDFRDARIHFDRALQAYEGADHRPGQLASHINLAEAASHARDDPAAMAHLDQARALAAQISPASLRRIDLMTASLALRNGRLDQAREALDRQLSTPAPQAHNDPLYLSLLANRAQLALLANEADTAQRIAHFSQALALYQQADRPLLDARLLRFEATLAGRHGDPGQAQDRLQAALALYKASLHRVGMAATLEELATNQLSMGQPDGARRALHRALALRAYLQDRPASRAILNRLIALGTGGTLDYAAWLKRLEGTQVMDWPGLLSALGESASAP